MRPSSFFLICLAIASIPLVAAASTPPNIVIIYADDVGYGDVGAYGAEKIPTPHIDQLAASGIQFLDGHATAATCTPSRYSMLTGFYGFREGVDILAPSAPLCIPTDKLTLPRMLQEAGYATAVIGKWHLGLGKSGEPLDWNGPIKPGPLEVGFDYAYLLPVTNDRVPCVYVENHHVVNLDPADPLYITEGPKPPAGFSGTVYAIGREDPAAQTYGPADDEHASSVINGIARIGYQWGGKSALWKDELMADHFVDQARSYIAAHKDQPFFLYFASQDTHVPRAPHPRFQGKTSLGKRGDATVQLDWTVGEIIKALEINGLRENTLVIFSSDNGPVYDDGYADGTEVRKSNSEVDNGHDGSGRFRGGKYQIYEGGTRVPFIVSWPARIEAGQRSDALVSQVDFIASIARLTGVELPRDSAPDSRDTLATFLGEDDAGLEYTLGEAPGAISLRRGPWKLIQFNDRSWAHDRAKGETELYYLASDSAEANNIAFKHPEIVSELQGLLQSAIANGRLRD